GILCASIFYTGIQLISNYTLLSFVFAWFIPLIGVFVMNYDFTVEKNWQEDITATSYQVNFDYFHGHHHIPFHLKEKEVLSFQIRTYARNGGGWAYYIEAPHTGELSLETKESDDVAELDYIRFRAPEKGTHYLVLTGSRLSGSFFVEWSIS